MEKMKLRAIVATAVTLFATHAAAADSNWKPPEWSGFWASAGVGYGLWDADTHTVFAPTGACVLCENQTAGGRGVLGNFGIGYDYAIGPKLLIGTFVDYTVSRMRGTIEDQGPLFVADT
jgi:hypothetical protein